MGEIRCIEAKADVRSLRWTRRATGFAGRFHWHGVQRSTNGRGIGFAEFSRLSSDRRPIDAANGSVQRGVELGIGLVVR
jgi:hypothetical protein